MRTIALVMFFQIFFTTQAYSQDANQEECLEVAPWPIDVYELDDDFLQMFRNGDWFATTPNLVEKAPCRKKRSYTEMVSELSKISNQEPLETLEFRGLEFKQQNKELIQSFIDLVSKRDVFGELRDNDEQPNLSAAKDCHDVLCATRAIFGHRIGPKLLFMRQKFGMNGSDLVYRNSSRLKTDEINSFIRSLDDLPEHMIPFVKNKQMTRFRRGYTLKSYGNDGGRVLANASMSFFDGWENKKREGERDYICTHEIGHVIAREFEFDRTPEWLSLSNWEDLGDDWRPEKDDNFISHYAYSSPGEDFAESVSAYRYNPKTLKEIAPRKYEFIKNNVYAGIEYLNENTCRKEAPLLAENKEKIELLINENPSRLDDIFADIYEQCASEFSDELTRLGGKNNPELDQCILDLSLRNALSDGGQELSLEQKSLAKHTEHVFMSSPGFSEERSRTISSARKIVNDQLRDDFIDALEANMNILHENALENGDCNEFAKATYDSENIFGSISYSIKDVFKDFSLDYCELHLQNHGTQKELNSLDLRYTINRFFKDRVQSEEEQWRTVEALQQRRTELLNDLKSRGSIDRVMSWFISDPLNLELSEVETQLKNALDEL